MVSAVLWTGKEPGGARITTEPEAVAEERSVAERPGRHLAEPVVERDGPSGEVREDRQLSG